jgi:hypothetical protein
MDTKFWSENLKEKDYMEELGVYGRIILNLILEKYCEDVCIGCIWLRIEAVAAPFEQDNKPLGPLTGGEFLDYLSDS